MILIAVVIAILAMGLYFVRQPLARTAPSGEDGVRIVRGSAPPSARRQHVPTAATRPSPPAEQRSAFDTDFARLDRMLSSFPPNMAQMNAVKYEQRDEKWASQSEAVLNAEYKEILKPLGDNAELHSYCKMQTCAVVVAIAPDRQRDEAAQAQSDVQSLDVLNKMADGGLWNAGAAFGPSSANDREMMVTFYSRSRPQRRR